MEVPIELKSLQCAVIVGCLGESTAIDLMLVADEDERALDPRKVIVSWPRNDLWD
jgi:hypothetical protein